MKRKPTKFRSAEAAKLHREQEAAWQDLLKRHPPTGVEKPRLGRNSLPDYLGKELAKRKRTPDLKSVGAVDRKFEAQLEKHLTAEMQEREAAAQKEIARKRKRVAPMWNKGGLQYITDDTDLTTIGRKV